MLTRNNKIIPRGFFYNYIPEMGGSSDEVIFLVIVSGKLEPSFFVFNL